MDKSMKQLAIAIRITVNAFADKYDQAGKPKILHCLRVMNGVNQTDEDLLCAAIMHDLIEDTEYTLEDLTNLGFSRRVVKAVDLLTHDETVSYEDYIKVVSTNKDATAIKLADLRDNSDITRLKGLRKKDHERIEKYHRAWIYLSN